MGEEDIPSKGREGERPYSREVDKLYKESRSLTRNQAQPEKLLGETGGGRRNVSSSSDGELSAVFS